MSTYTVPDHPVIRNMELTGFPDGKEPTYPHCPRCGEECEYVVIVDRKIRGCDVCAKYVSAWEMPECFPDEEL